MNIISATVVFIIILFTITVGWFSLTPVYRSLSTGLNASIAGLGLPSDSSQGINTTFTVFNFLWYILFGVIVLGFLAWLFIQSQRVEYETAEYY